MIDREKHNKALSDLKAARLARRVALVLIFLAAIDGDGIGVVIMSTVWALLYFALPVTH